MNNSRRVRVISLMLSSALAVFGLVAVTSSAQAVAVSATISGTIKNTAGTPLKGITGKVSFYDGEGSLRDAGVALTAQRDFSQVIGLMVRQLGQLFLQPMVDSMWQQLAGSDALNHG